MPDGFCALFLPAEILPAPLLIPPMPVPVVPLPAVPPVVDPLVVEPAAPVLTAGPPAPELPPPALPLLCANANGPATTSAAAKTIIAGFMMSFPCLLFESGNKALTCTTFLSCDVKIAGIA